MRAPPLLTALALAPAALQLAAGLGWDRYTGDADVRLREPRDTPIELKESRTLALVNVGLDQELSFFAGLGLRLGF